MKFNWMNLLKVLVIIHVASIIVGIVGAIAHIPPGSHFYLVTGMLTGLMVAMYGPKIITIKEK